MWRFTSLVANTLSLALTIGALTTQNISLLYAPVGIQLATLGLGAKRLRSQPVDKLIPIESATGNDVKDSVEVGGGLFDSLDDLDTYYYNLVIGRKQSRELFIQALSHATDSLIIVCPWIPAWTMNSEMISLFKTALRRGIKISIGYGHLADVGNDKTRLRRDILLSTTKAEWYRGVLALEKLQVEYSSLKLYVIGTHEKYYVVDNDYCVLGSHNFLTSDGRSSEREMGLHTNNPEVVSQLLNKGFYAAIA